jgi:hypothetical protein
MEMEINRAGTVAGGCGYANALEYLRSIYNDPLQPTHVRMKAAALALPHELPKLQAVLQGNMDDRFAGQLEAAVARSKAVMKIIEPPKLIEAQAEKPTNGHHSPSPAEVSTSAMGKSFSGLRRRA